MNIILAPHIDDELIGCFSILDSIDIVYYFYDLTPERKREAEKLKSNFNYEIIYTNEDKIQNIDFSKDTLYIPSSKDLHNDHRKINRLGNSLCTLNTMYYSIDMNRVPIKLDKSDVKKRLMYQYYPSQKNLFNSDEKYFLFEDIHKKDYTEYTRLENESYYIEVDTTDYELSESFVLPDFKKNIGIYYIIKQIRLKINGTYVIIHYKNKKIELFT